ncbi:MAG: hypothetical protein ACFFBD_07420, partial [Candidatus Hodarchaeota archaeon]
DLMTNQNSDRKPLFRIHNYLSGLRWRNLPPEELRTIRIGYRDKDRIKYVSADKIISSGRHYFFVEEHRIPIHRVRIIKEGDRVIYQSTKYQKEQDPDL